VLTQFAAVVLISISVPVAAQSGSSASPPQDAAGKTLTLTGCVAQNPDDKQFTFSDSEGGIGPTYRLTGAKVKSYAGRQVQIVGTVVTKRFVITGGLLPNPNVAGQAGAIDPAQAAMAGTESGVGTRTAQLPEFRVKTVRAIGGDCPR
jgi:hypothetical protein